MLEKSWQIYINLLFGCINCYLSHFCNDFGASYINKACLLLRNIKLIAKNEKNILASTYKYSMQIA